MNLEHRLGSTRPEYPWLLQKVLTPKQCAVVYRFAVERAWTDHLSFQIAHQIKRILLALNWVEQQMSAIFDHKVEERLRELPEFKGNLIDFGFLEDEEYQNIQHHHHQYSHPPQEIKATETESSHQKQSLIQKTTTNVKTKLRQKFGKKTGVKR
jgi:C4-dicarboxylate-specific signal transduction histidine kinase